MGYIEENSWNWCSQSEQLAIIEECTAFDKARRRAGQWLGGIALQGPRTAKTVRSKGDKAMVTDGPYAETKEQLGGVVVMGLKDLSQAVELLSTHPALRYGVAMEIRPIDEEIDACWKAKLDQLKAEAR